MKKILILSSPHPKFAAGVVAFDIYQALKTVPDYDVRFLTERWDNFEDKNIKSVENFFQFNIKRIKNKLSRFVFKKQKARLIADLDPDYHMDLEEQRQYFSTKTIIARAGFKPDFVIVLFTQKFISYQNIEDLSNIISGKVFLYPMDMLFLTGGCHYAWQCNGYKSVCGSCPGLRSSDPKDQSFLNLTFKISKLKNNNISVFAANSQLHRQLKASAIFKNREIIANVYTVPDRSVFFSKKMDEARKTFQISTNKIVLFVGACSLADRRKGINVLIDSLTILYGGILPQQRENILILIAGLKVEEVDKNLSFETKYLGFLSNYSQLALAYCSANFFISPSLEDSGPTMVLQAMFCNTPVVSFNIGYAEDFLVSGINGFSATQKTPEALASSISAAISLSDTDYLAMKLALADTAAKISISSVTETIKFSIDSIKGEA